MQLMELRVAKVGSEKLNIAQKQDINGQWTVMFHCNHNSSQETNNPHPSKKQTNPPPEVFPFGLLYTIHNIIMNTIFHFLSF